MKQSPVPKLEDEVAYAVEAFEDENDRKPNESELLEIKKEAQSTVDSAIEAYAEWKAGGYFECVICGSTHQHWAPKSCRQAYNADI